ncbi:MAG: hypothetical protein KAQ65_02615, partial [Candidatus Thorarchaeota archaeon]|nr:hypothetical protein [Candidatus Thorarchaeota archaeon]
MKMKLGVTLLVVLFLVGTLPSINTLSSSMPVEQSSSTENEIDSMIQTPNQEFLTSDQSITGILDPLGIEQKGFVSTGNVSASTDIPLNTENNLPIDTIHDWVASEANVEVSNLTRLYANNGTFTNGIPGINEDPAMDPEFYPFGWNSSSYCVNSAIQRSFYESTEDSYAGLENEGAPIGTGVNLRFAHGLGTFVNWIQDISNIPYSENFVFSIDFSYINGPLDVALGTAISLELLVNGSIYWNQSLASLASHNTWYKSGDVNVSFPGAPS